LISSLSICFVIFEIDLNVGDIKIKHIRKVMNKFLFLEKTSAPFADNKMNKGIVYRAKRRSNGYLQITAAQNAKKKTIASIKMGADLLRMPYATAMPDIRIGTIWSFSVKPQNFKKSCSVFIQVLTSSILVGIGKKPLFQKEVR